MLPWDQLTALLSPRKYSVDFSCLATTRSYPGIPKSPPKSSLPSKSTPLSRPRVMLWLIGKSQVATLGREMLLVTPCFAMFDKAVLLSIRIFIWCPRNRGAKDFRARKAMHNSSKLDYLCIQPCQRPLTWLSQSWRMASMLNIIHSPGIRGTTKGGQKESWSKYQKSGLWGEEGWSWPISVDMSWVRKYSIFTNFKKRRETATS